MRFSGLWGSHEDIHTHVAADSHDYQETAVNKHLNACFNHFPRPPGAVCLEGGVVPHIIPTSPNLICESHRTIILHSPASLVGSYEQENHIAMSHENSRSVNRQIPRAELRSASNPHQSAISSVLDSRLRHLTINVLPRQPYLISVPSDIPYRHSSRFTNRWYIGTPFSREEEQLQYMSFLRHQEEESSLLKAVGVWSDENGKMLEEDVTSREIYRNGANSPISSGQRKKITLNDYKKKGKAETGRNVIPNPKSVGEMREPEQQKDKVLGPTVPDNTAPDNAALMEVSKNSGQKRKRSHEEAAEPHGRSAQNTTPSPHSEKRIKLSPAATGRQNADMEKSRADDQTTQTGKAGVENLAEPIIEAEKVAQMEDVPEMFELLSPTLPPPIEEFLANEPEVSQSEGGLDHDRTDLVRSTLVGASSGTLVQAGVKSSPQLKPHFAGSRIRSGSQHSAKSVYSMASGTDVKINRSFSPTTREPAIKAVECAPTSIIGGLNSSPGRSPGPRRRYTVVLKYGKKNRRRVEALLKFAPRGKKHDHKTILEQKRLPEQSQGTTDDQTSHVQKEKGSTSDMSSEPVKNRQKLAPTSLNLSDRPRTPISSSRKLPVPSGAMPPRSAVSTPKRDFKATMVRRVESSDGMADGHTPPAGPSRQSTPLSIERRHIAARLSPAPTSALTTRDDDRKVWHALHQKYFELGRTIKKEGTSQGPSPTSNPNDRDSALSVVLLVEALLCFMINTTAVSHAQPNADPGWRNIVPYHIYVFRASRKFPHLHGLVVQLGAVCRQHINRYDMDRLARDPLPDEHANGSAPTPGSDGNTKVNDDIEKYKKRYIEFRNELVTNARELQVAWLDGSRILSSETLKREYPSTWAQRSKDTSTRGMGKLEPSKGIDGEFWLPMDASTTPLEAVRFSIAFLEEWAKKDDLKWKARVEL